MYDYHLHSHFSDDCVEKMEDTILEAIKMGGKQLCFTDHLDYDYPDQSIKFEFDIEGFNEMIESLKDKYKDQLHIQRGIEVGLQPHVISATEAFIKDILDIKNTNKWKTDKGLFWKWPSTSIPKILKSFKVEINGDPKFYRVL